MKKLLIIAAGGFGRELYAWASQHPDCGRAWQLAGFLDDNSEALKPFGSFAPVWPLAGHKPAADQLYLIGLGSPMTKEKLIAPLISGGAEFLTFVHPSAIIGARVTLGRGVVICPGAILSVDIDVGEFAMVNLNCTIGHDAQIGRWTSLSAHCDITGGARVGQGCFFGSRATVIPGKNIGDRTVVAAGAVVMTHVPSDVLVAGNPARVI
jgi:sugar O-acyltransferase (sialic acid O-acetyltransferase NeuD family)